MRYVLRLINDRTSCIYQNPNTIFPQHGILGQLLHMNHPTVIQEQPHLIPGNRTRYEMLFRAGILKIKKQNNTYKGRQ